MCRGRLPDTDRPHHGAQLCFGHLARYGGEEFLYTVLSDRPASVHGMGETFRQAVEALQLPSSADGRSPVTISLGFSSRPVLSEEDWNQLLHASDQALYQAKASGKNRVWIPDPLAAGEQNAAAGQACSGR